MMITMAGMLSAESTDAVTLLVPPLMQLGVVGIVIAGLAWFATSAVKRERGYTDLERARADRSEQAQEQLQRAMREEIIPVLVRCTDAMTRMTADIAAVLRDRRGPG